jgi:hypothetical protein
MIFILDSVMIFILVLLVAGLAALVFECYRLENNCRCSLCRKDRWMRGK